MASDAEITAMVEKVLAHLKTPEGQRELRESHERCERAVEELRRAARVPWEKLHEQFTI